MESGKKVLFRRVFFCFVFVFVFADQKIASS